jgi:hypothetical protein
MTVGETAKLALLWRGDCQARRNVTPHNNRLNRIFEALAALGVHAEPAVYADDIADEVREQLLRLDGVLVWVDPLSEGRNRITLDAMLRDVASRGIWVSAHPNVILKMGVKEVLLPADNEPNAKADLPPDLLGDLKITYVHTLDDALEHALEKEGVAPPIVPQAAPKQKRPDSPRAIH